MKKWEQEAQTERKLTLAKRLTYALIGFIVSGVVSFWIYFLVLWLLDDFAGHHIFTKPGLAGLGGWLLLIPSGVTLFFTIGGFVAGDKGIEGITQFFDWF